MKSQGLCFKTMITVVVVCHLVVPLLHVQGAAQKEIVWERTNGLYGGSVGVLVINSAGHIFGGTAGAGVFCSTDYGQTWTHAGLADTEVLSLAVNAEGHLFAGTLYDVFRSTDHGQTWASTGLGSGSPVYFRSLLVSAAGDIFVGSYLNGAFRSTDDGQTWTRISHGLGSDNVIALSPTPSGHLLAGTFDSGIFRSTDNGDTWTPATLQVSSSPRDRRLGASSFAAHASGHLWAGTQRGVFRSTDDGQTWTRVALEEYPIIHLAQNASGDVFAVNGYPFSGGRDYRGFLFRSRDDGQTWTNVGVAGRFYTTVAINAADHIFAGTLLTGMLRSTDNGTTWAEINTGLANVSVGSLVVNASGHIFGVTHAGVVRSTDGGQSWVPVNTGLPGDGVLTLAIQASGHLLAGTVHGVFRSIDNGETWGPTGSLSIPDPPSVARLLVTPSGHIFASVYDFGLFRSTDDGQTWVQLDLGLEPGLQISSLAASRSGDLFAGADLLGLVYRSTDNGETWTATHLTIEGLPIASGVNALIVDEAGNLFAAAPWGVFRSTDDGATWTEPGFIFQYVSDLVVDETGHLFVASVGDGVYRSTDGGATWMPVNTGLTTTRVSSLAFGPLGIMFAGTGGGVFRSVGSTLSAPRSDRQRIDPVADNPRR